VSYRERQRLSDIQAAIDAIRSHLQRGDLSDGLVFDAVRIRPQPIKFGPRHAEALRQNAQAATAKWLEIFKTQGRVPWASIRAQMRLSRWRFLSQAPEAAAILRNALSRLPEDLGRSNTRLGG
jgi:hypothetical protein